MIRSCLPAALACCLFGIGAARAQPADPAPDAPVAMRSGLGEFLDEWSANVRAARAGQPAWQVPLVTAAPLLVERARFDVSLQRVRTGTDLTSYGAASSISLIPFPTTEIAFGIPSYDVVRRDGGPDTEGYNDLPAFSVKQRLSSANEAAGDYVLSASLSAVAPTGVDRFSTRTWRLTPGLGGGKGFGRFDIQAYVGLTVPTDQDAPSGNLMQSSMVLQYKLTDKIWPELEWNRARWFTGTRAGRTQDFVTAGVVAGPYHVAGSAGISVGAGYQVAAGPAYQSGAGAVPTYAHAVLTSFRLGF